MNSNFSSELCGMWSWLTLCFCFQFLCHRKPAPLLSRPRMTVLRAGIAGVVWLCLIPFFSLSCFTVLPALSKKEKKKAVLVYSKNDISAILAKYSAWKYDSLLIYTAVDLNSCHTCSHVACIRVPFVCMSHGS